MRVGRFLPSYRPPHLWALCLYRVLCRYAEASSPHGVELYNSVVDFSRNWNSRISRKFWRILENFVSNFYFIH